MKHKLSTILELIVLLTMALAASPAKAQNGPYYAWPSWDQQLPANTRFIRVLPDLLCIGQFCIQIAQASLDRETGLVWEQMPSTSTFPWFSTSAITAASHCNFLRVGNRGGWRLPTLQELASLVDLSVFTPGPRLPPGHPFTNVQSSTYWSATASAFNATLAWGVVFDFGVVGVGGKVDEHFVWCVRGGQGVDPQ